MLMPDEDDDHDVPAVGEEVEHVPWCEGGMLKTSDVDDLGGLILE